MSARVRSAWDALHYPVVMLVFAVNGALVAYLGHPLLNDVIGIEGSLWSGPWGYRVVHLALIPPMYSVLLLVTGTLFGKRAYFTMRGPASLGPHPAGAVVARVTGPTTAGTSRPASGAGRGSRSSSSSPGRTGPG